MSDRPLRLKLENYEGPLGLLLHLIKINKVDIYDIPVSLITAQYLEFVVAMDFSDLDEAGDFLLMAATLTHIKSRLLLPTDAQPGEEPAADPREELVRPLLEYAAFQAAAETLSDRPQLDRDVFLRGAAFLNDEKLQNQPREIKSTLFELMKAWNNLIGRRTVEEDTLKFKIETKTIGEKLEEIRNLLTSIKSVHFKDLARSAANVFELALSFLAVLELARVGFLRLHQDTETDFAGPQLFLADPEATTTSPEQLDYR
ncbi:MAG: segregation/condensation protein A [Deltaproteobacteria bacterium]|jgi:segregation and condensation protein A|nr:segregation/condensation protein A [Deltaproteobacteria bacterium]